MSKGDKPRNCFSKQYRDNYDSINWPERFDIRTSKEPPLVVTKSETCTLSGSTPLDPV